MGIEQKKILEEMKEKIYIREKIEDKMKEQVKINKERKRENGNERQVGTSVEKRQDEREK